MESVVATEKPPIDDSRLCAMRFDEHTLHVRGNLIGFERPGGRMSISWFSRSAIDELIRWYTSGEKPHGAKSAEPRLC